MPSVLSPEPVSSLCPWGRAPLTRHCPPLLPLPGAGPGRGGRQARSPAAAASPAPPEQPLEEAVRPGPEHGGWSVSQVPPPMGGPCPPPPPPHLAEDVQDAIGGEEVSHIHAGVLHPDPLEGSGQSSATGGLKWTLKGVWRLPGTRAPTGGPQPGPDTLIQDLQDGTRASPGPM